MADVWRNPIFDDDCDDIIERVRRGAMTREQAEAWAREQGKEAFQREPDISNFHPAKEIYWTLPMAFAWAIWRNMAKVAQLTDAYRKESWSWHVSNINRPKSPPEFDASGNQVWEHLRGHELRPGEPFTCWRVHLETLHTAMVLDSKVAADELSRRLQSGEIVAFGKREHSEQSAEIEAINWHGIDILNLDETPHDAATLNNKQKYYEIRLQQNELLEHFSERKATSGQEYRGIVLLTEYLNQHRNNVTKLGAKQFLAGQGFQFGTHAFGRIWPKAREAAGLSPQAPAGRKSNRNTN